jgi:hypothetical protein
MGQIMMATDYNPSDATFDSVIEMLNNEFTTEVVPSSNCIHLIECKPSLTNNQGLLFI